MIQFYINKNEIVLPRDYSFTDIDENSLITSNGKYTLDVTVSLLELKNAIAFKHINRLNNINTILEDEMIMIANHQVRIGKIIILMITDSYVTFQFVAGNSELNFLSSQTQKIWELDFGTEAAVDYQRALFSIQHPGYGDVVENNISIGFNKFVCVPVKFSNLIANDYVLSQCYLGYAAHIENVNNIVIQPYWMHYIETLPGILGFEIVENVLRDDALAKEIFLPNRVQSLKYSDMLPDISIGEFVDATEEFFNVVFYIDENRKCYILNKDTFMDQKDVVKLTDVLDQFEINPSVDKKDYDGISYNLSTDGYHRYQKLDSEIIRQCDEISYSSASVMKNSISESQLNKFLIHKTTNNDRQHVFTPSTAINIYRLIVSATSGYCNYVNKFRDSSENPLTLKVTPLPFTYVEKELYYFYDQGSIQNWLIYQLPSINSNLYEKEDQFILDAIESSIVQLPRADKIEIGLFSGMLPLFHYNDISEVSNILFPFSYLDNMPEFWLPSALYNHPSVIQFEQDFNLWITNNYTPVCARTLRLIGSDGLQERYFVNRRYDTTVEYVFIIKDNPDLKSTNLFEFNNQIYIPIRFERTRSLESAGRVKGYFYRMKN